MLFLNFWRKIFYEGGENVEWATGTKEGCKTGDPKMLEWHFFSLLTETAARIYPATGAWSPDERASEYLAIFVTLSDVAQWSNTCLGWLVAEWGLAVAAAC